MRPGVLDVPMPSGAVILSAGSQDGLCVWALVEATAVTEHRRIRVVYTGDGFEMLNTTKFIGTIQCGDLVYHVFDEGVV